MSERESDGLYRWGRIVAGRVMRDELGQTNPVDIEDAESVSHYAVSYALGRWDQGRGDASTLVAMAVRRRVIQWWVRDYRHRRGKVALTWRPAEEPEGEGLCEPGIVEGGFDRFLSSDYIRSCLRRLPTQERRLLVEVYLKGRRLAEVAQTVGRSPRTLEKDLRRARERFAGLVRE